MKKITKETLKQKLKKILLFIANPRLLLCLGIAWIITNGWSYVLFAVGTALQIHWMIAVSSAYLAFLWLPVSPEKLATVAIAIALLRFFFPGDTKTLAVLRELRRKTHDVIHRRREKRRVKRAAKRAAKRTAKAARQEQPSPADPPAEKQ